MNRDTIDLFQQFLQSLDLADLLELRSGAAALRPSRLYGTALAFGLADLVETECRRRNPGDSLFRG